MGHQNKGKRKDLLCNHFKSAEAHNQNKSPNLPKHFSFEDYYNVLQTNCYNHLSVRSFIITGTFRGPPMTCETTYTNQN